MTIKRAQKRAQISRGVEVQTRSTAGAKSVEVSATILACVEAIRVATLIFGFSVNWVMNDWQTVLMGVDRCWVLQRCQAPSEKKIASCSCERKSSLRIKDVGNLSITSAFK